MNRQSGVRQPLMNRLFTDDHGDRRRTGDIAAGNRNADRGHVDQADPRDPDRLTIKHEQAAAGQRLADFRGGNQRRQVGGHLNQCRIENSDARLEHGQCDPALQRRDQARGEIAPRSDWKRARHVSSSDLESCFAWPARNKTDQGFSAGRCLVSKQHFDRRRR